MENKYQSRIRERAEQFYKKFKSLNPYCAPKSEWYNDMYALAKISVDAEAEAVRKAYEGRCTQTYINDYLISEGLIPPPETNIEQGGVV